MELATGHHDICPDDLGAGGPVFVPCDFGDVAWEDSGERRICDEKTVEYYFADLRRERGEKAEAFGVCWLRSLPYEERARLLDVSALC